TALCACARDPLEQVRFGQLRGALPAWRDKAAHGSAGSGSLERRDGKGAVAALSWDADERPGAPTALEARLAAGMGPAAAATPGSVSNHPAVELTEGDARAVVWRCDRTRRLLRLSLNEQ